MRQKLYIMHDCDRGISCYHAPSSYECDGYYICSRCKLCTSDGSVVKFVKRNNIIYEVCHVTCDEIILFAKELDDLISIDPYKLDEFRKNFQLVKDKNEW